MNGYSGTAPISWLQTSAPADEKHSPTSTAAGSRATMRRQRVEQAPRVDRAGGAAHRDHQLDRARAPLMTPSPAWRRPTGNSACVSTCANPTSPQQRRELGAAAEALDRLRQVAIGVAIAGHRPADQRQHVAVVDLVEEEARAIGAEELEDRDAPARAAPRGAARASRAAGRRSCARRTPRTRRRTRRRDRAGGGRRRRGCRSRRPRGSCGGPRAASRARSRRRRRARRACAARSRSRRRACPHPDPERADARPRLPRASGSPSCARARRCPPT